MCPMLNEHTVWAELTQNLFLVIYVSKNNDWLNIKLRLMYNLYYKDLDVFKFYWTLNEF